MKVSAIMKEIVSPLDMIKANVYTMLPGECFMITGIASKHELANVRTNLARYAKLGEVKLKTRVINDNLIVSKIA